MNFIEFHLSLTIANPKSQEKISCDVCESQSKFPTAAQNYIENPGNGGKSMCYRGKGKICKHKYRQNKQQYMTHCQMFQKVESDLPCNTSMVCKLPT